MTSFIRRHDVLRGLILAALAPLLLSAAGCNKPEEAAFDLDEPQRSRGQQLLSNAKSFAELSARLQQQMKNRFAGRVSLTQQTEFSSGLVAGVIEGQPAFVLRGLHVVFSAPLPLEAAIPATGELIAQTRLLCRNRAPAGYWDLATEAEVYHAWLAGLFEMTLPQGVTVDLIKQVFSFPEGYGTRNLIGEEDRKALLENGPKHYLCVAITDQADPYGILF